MTAATVTRIGRPNRSQEAANNWRDDALALLTERAAIRDTATKILPFARYVHQASEDVIAEQAQAGVVVFLEKLAGPKDAA